MVGFSGFNDGLFWITNPAEFEDVLESFLDDTEFAHYDNYHVIARSAYGQLYLWGERTGASLDIATHLNWIMTNQGHAKDISKGDANIAIQSFFGFQDKEYIDVEVSSKPLFPSAIKKHGPVGKEEVMVFTPYLFMGGKKSADAMIKEDLHVFLQVMADLGEPKLSIWRQWSAMSLKVTEINPSCIAKLKLTLCGLFCLPSIDLDRYLLNNQFG